MTGQLNPNKEIEELREDLKKLENPLKDAE